MSFLFTYLHFLSFIVLIALLASEYFLMRQKLTLESLNRIKKIDLYYGIAAGTVLATGIARVYHEKGLDYYLESHVFWTKIALFIIMAIVSLYPTILFIKAKSETDLSVVQYTQVKKAILAQILLVPGIIFMAIWMARGIY